MSSNQHYDFSPAFFLSLSLSLSLSLPLSLPLSLSSTLFLLYPSISQTHSFSLTHFLPISHIFSFSHTHPLSLAPSHTRLQSLFFSFFISLDGVTTASCASQIFRNAFARNQETNSRQFLRVVQLCIGEKRSGALSALVKVRYLI